MIPILLFKINKPKSAFFATMVMILLIQQVACVQNPFPDSASLQLRLDIHDIVHKELVISPNAAITFTEGEKTFHATLSPEQMATLKNLIIETAFLTYQPDPDDGTNLIMDAVPFTLTISLGKQSNCYTSKDCWGEDEWEGFNRIIEWLMTISPRKIEIIGWA